MSNYKKILTWTFKCVQQKDQLINVINQPTEAYR